jgi:hydrogenase maturation protein HypF
VMLPSSPLHHLLLEGFGAPLVATSGNLSGEPICTDEREALLRLANVADFFLVHDRPILRALDDSVLREVAGQELLLRRARGYAPIVKLHKPLPSVLAVGGHLKNTIALSLGSRAVISQHLGDLDTAEARSNFSRTVAETEAVFGVLPDRVACDLHPDYASSRFAEEYEKPLIRVQHHYAHVLSCMAEHALEPTVLGIAWDGLGLGGDGTLWGGEFLVVEITKFNRIAHFRSFPLPGGEKAVREPRRSALGLLYESIGEAALDRTDLPPIAAFAPQELKTLAQMLSRELNAPRCSSVGRLFDAVASLLDLRQINGFEGDAAMAVEFAAEQAETVESYPFSLIETYADSEPRWIVDWEPTMLALLDDIKRSPPAVAAAKFHRTLADIAVAVAQKAGVRRIALSGGAFQNRLLTELIVSGLETAGFEVFRHRQIPPNDGGLALGQLMAAGRLDSPD